jgi:hypothetical protein
MREHAVSRIRHKVGEGCGESQQDVVDRYAARWE